MSAFAAADKIKEMKRKKEIEAVDSAPKNKRKEIVQKLLKKKKKGKLGS